MYRSGKAYCRWINKEMGSESSEIIYPKETKSSTRGNIGSNTGLTSYNNDVIILLWNKRFLLLFIRSLTSEFVFCSKLNNRFMWIIKIIYVISFKLIYSFEKFLESIVERTRSLVMLCESYKFQFHLLVAWLLLHRKFNMKLPSRKSS